MPNDSVGHPTLDRHRTERGSHTDCSTKTAPGDRLAAPDSALCSLRQLFGSISCLLSVIEVRPGGAPEGTLSSVARWGLALFAPAADASPSRRGHGRCARSAQTMRGANGRASRVRRSAPDAARGSLLRAYLCPSAHGPAPTAPVTQARAPLDPACALAWPPAAPSERSVLPGDLGRPRPSEAADPLHMRQAHAREGPADWRNQAPPPEAAWQCGPSESHVSAGQRPASLSPSAEGVDVLLRAASASELTCGR
jgi:hypothetical protein